MKKKLKKFTIPQGLLLLGELKKKNIIQEFSLVLSIVISYSSPVTKCIFTIPQLPLLRQNFVVKQWFIVTKQLVPFKNL